MYHGERFNSVSHLVGTVAAAAGLIGLVYSAVTQNDLWKIISFTLYGSTLFLLYLTSTLYHSARRGRLKSILQKIDHFAIYLLIAGSYTPFTLVTLESDWGIPLFIAVWGLAVIGIISDAFSRSESRPVAMILYLLMGWMIVVALHPLSQALPTGGMAGLLLGGIFYTGGLIFYLRDNVIRHGHGIWHLFVLAGSTSHFVVVAAYVA